MFSRILRHVASINFVAALLLPLFADSHEIKHSWELPSEAGDYSGTRLTPGGQATPLFAQVIPDEEGQYRVRLASTLDERVDALIYLSGETRFGNPVFHPGVAFASMEPLQVTERGLLFDATQWRAGIVDGVVRGSTAGSESSQFLLQPMGLERYEGRTLGEKPPQGAVVLFNGRNLRRFEDTKGGKAQWDLVKKEKAMEIVPKTGGIVSKDTFGDHRLHIEFRSSWMPAARGQKRGNSGVYVHGRYEVQVLDSYGLSGEWNECGGIYRVAKPKVNMCAPPTVWQTYDIDFTAPRFDDHGEKVANARITVRHNGVLIHDDVELPGTTGGALSEEEVAAGPLMLQNHGGDPVQYRNIWVLEKSGEGADA